MMKRVSLLVIPLLAGCSSMPDSEGMVSGISKALDISPLLHPYRIDVRQGNLVTQEMVAQLKPGLTRDQVRFVLGTPMLTDIFHANRWDYVYRLKTGEGEVQQRRLVVFFEDDKLVRLGGDVVGDPTVNAGTIQKPAARVIDIPGPQPAADGSAQAKPDQAPKADKAQSAASAPAVSQ